jgi:hypothetical protein
MNGKGARAFTEHVDDGPAGAGHRWKERLGHGVGPEEVDGQVAFEHGGVGQVVGQRDAGVVDQHVQ